MRLSISIVSIYFVLLSGCSDAVTWTGIEIENGQRVFAAIKAANEAGLLLQEYESDASRYISKSELIERLQQAHIQAVQVNDITLDKMHPSMHLHFRTKFQHSLASLIRYYKGDNSVDANSATQDMAEFQQWFKTHQRELRLW